jgi:hypothetical protein
MPAPGGNFEFDVLGSMIGINEMAEVEFKLAFPNPSHGITCIPVSFNKNTKGSLKLFDVIGNEVATIFEGDFQIGEKNFFINGTTLGQGAYILSLETTEGRFTQKLMVQ